MSEFTIDDLKRIMRQCAGEDESVGLDGDILDRSFDELGYDSLALLETASRTEREFGVKLPEELMGDVATARDYLSFVNGRLAERV
jgi:act minimal PKS acyl carrier protein